MSRLTDLIAQAKAKDPQTGADLEREFKDTMYPGLVSHGKVERGATSPITPSSTPRTITRSRRSHGRIAEKWMPST